MTSPIETFAVTVGVPTLSLVISAYSAMRRSNVELLCGKLLESGIDLSVLRSREDLQRYFVNIVEKVSLEANQEKIEKWKNAILHLGTDFKDFNYKDNYIAVLDALSVMDITIMTTFYEKNNWPETVAFFNGRGVSDDFLAHTLRKLISNNLIDEQVSSSLNGSIPNVLGGKTSLTGVKVQSAKDFRKTSFGQEFINFISGEFGK